MSTQALEFIYQETEIHFLINTTDDNVMVNATETTCGTPYSYV